MSMDQVGNGNFTSESDTRLEISIAEDDIRLFTQLTEKLAEYRAREQRYAEDAAYTHPEYRALQLGAEMFKGDILAFVLESAAVRDIKETPVTLREIADSLEERHGYDLTVVKEAPLVFDASFGVYCHDQVNLHENGGEMNLGFSNAFWIVQSYTIGGNKAVWGGTGLPEIKE
jgi:hypothetical protein